MAGGRSVPVRCDVWWRVTMPFMRTGTRKREGLFLEHGVSVALRATCRAVVSACDGCGGAVWGASEKGIHCDAHLPNMTAIVLRCDGKFRGTRRGDV